MSSPITGATTEALLLALDAASMRQQAIANNVANAGTEGYVPLRVNFEEQLNAFRGATSASDSEVHQSLQGVRAFLEQEPIISGAGASQVMLDMEIVKLSQNMVQYQTLLRGVKKQLELYAIAVNDGKR